MKISIITPSYNSEKYIRETMESIHDQSYTNFEHIVVDGLSGDKTSEIVRSYNDIIFVSEKDSGQSNAINKGFRLVTGDIVAWQNADDTYLPGAFEKVASVFKANPHIDVVYGNYQLIDSVGKWVCDVKPIEWNAWMFSHGRFVPMQPTVFWRRKVLDDLGPLDETLHYCMDVDYFSRMVKKGAVFKLIPELLGQFRVHASSKTQNRDNEKIVEREHRMVLARNFNYSVFDFVIFEALRLRAKLAKKVKTRSF
jgi:glycosyltransferase involved in cell wall biosynthesis